MLLNICFTLLVPTSKRSRDQGGNKQLPTGKAFHDRLQTLQGYYAGFGQRVSLLNRLCRGLQGATLRIRMGGVALARAFVLKNWFNRCSNCYML